ncbi:PREDICTED: dolichol-phosphate mannosyltransferase subunit 3-like [Amphimedon queenslandica]|uniref:Dolichol-phosphate mannosyltransferase subunit 3 n=1 Tax=Amphimedon queenslandica TaxID=400682 RepID=A0A1X7VBL7_AMPQE|nr:PREDICTED: dolichol-phosphate mannosyltransferase subunit 3-like [Amphimedon queenslandica]|eukprot:XP_011402585.1 PREDICTED: dolichol-phosphate mannosyltransferase subunit 3-like [Amphimedon queenslandica]
MVVCTKLVQWLAIAAFFMELWYGLVVGWFPINISPQLYQVLLPMPLYAIMLLGCYSLIAVGYQLMTFSDCPEAADEIKQEIQMAKRDLASKGFKF